jgi:hypothetical protein
LAGRGCPVDKCVCRLRGCPRRGSRAACPRTHVRMDIRIQCIVVHAHDCESLAGSWPRALRSRIPYETDDECVSS